MTQTHPEPPRTKELLLVLALQLILTGVLVHTADVTGLMGLLPALVGAVFILLPVVALDRSDRAYGRYGLVLTNPLRELLPVAITTVVTCAPIAAFVLLFPGIWGVQRDWSPVWPPGYAQVAAAHFLLVALPEEFFYRGYLLGRLDDRWPPRWLLLGVPVGAGLPLSAGLFAMGHFVASPSPDRLLVFFPALVFGWLRAKRKNIAAPVLYHGCCNIFMDLFRAGFGL